MGDMGRTRDWLSSRLRMIVGLHALVALAGVVRGQILITAVGTTDGTTCPPAGGRG
jgi:hypothetical protein